MKSCAVFNDISGFGSCSLTACIPILSAKKIKVHPIVTGVFSNQTGFDDFYFSDLTLAMAETLQKWQSINPHFDAILSGFMLNEKQYDYLEQFINTFKSEDTLLLIDPVMGDGGKLYKGYTEAMTKKVKSLCYLADVITPNVTELKILSGEDDIIKGADKLLNSGIKSLVVTGIIKGSYISCLVFSDGKMKEYKSKIVKKNDLNISFSGTGDMFSSIILGELLNKRSLFYATKKAVKFIAKAIKKSEADNPRFGTDFEKILKKL